MKQKLCFSLAVFFLFSSMLFSEPKIARIYDADGDRIFENLKERLDQSAAGDQIPIIILYRDGVPLAGTSAVRLNHVSPQQIRFTYRNLPAVAAKLTKDQIEELKKDPWVEQIELDATMKATMATARASFGVDGLRKQFGFTGNTDRVQGKFSKNDIVIAVIDSGVNDRHPDLKGKVLFWQDLVNGRARPYDDNGHGTLVAGVALGSGKLNKKFIGVAPQAALVAFKVLDGGGSGTISAGIQAVDEVIQRKNQFNIRIINLSLAVSGSSNGKDSFSRACERAVDNGIVVVVAAGNEGPASRTIGAPSAAAKVITVGAGADTGEKGFFLAEFSSRGPTADGRVKPEIWGPGVRIQGPNAKGGYITLSGTSFSTPFVSGVVALMLEANPSLRPAGIKKILRDTAVPWAPGGKNNEAGSGRLQAYQAVTKAAGITKNLLPPVVPELGFSKGPILARETQEFDLPVISTSFNIAITVISLTNATGGLSVDLIDPNGNVLISKDSPGRQITITHNPRITGHYTIRVFSISSDTTFLLDASADIQ